LGLNFKQVWVSLSLPVPAVAVGLEPSTSVD
jgi:hypothetical protein